MHARAHTPLATPGVQAMAGGVAVDGGGGASGSVVPTLPRLNETPAERAAAEMQELLRYQVRPGPFTRHALVTRSTLLP